MNENTPASDRTRVATQLAAILASLVAICWGGLWFLGHVLWPAFARWAMQGWHF